MNNTLRIADALENFDSESGEPVRQPKHQGMDMWKGGQNDTTRGGMLGSKRRAVSSEQMCGRKASHGPGRPLKEVQAPNPAGAAYADQRVHNAPPPCAPGGFRNAIPRFAPGYQLGRGAAGVHEDETARLRSRVCLKQNDFTEDYELGGTIGQGTFGKVKKATEARTGKVVAVKMLGGKSFGVNELKAFLNECDILADIDHVNVPKLYGVYENKPNKYVMVMEYASGGELFERIQSQGSFNEESAANITRQLLSVLQYIHDKKIAHRDLKPENILFAGSERDLSRAQVQLIDFGFAKRMKAKGTVSTVELQQAFTHSSFQTRLGSPNYVAPEILSSKKGYGVEVDVWSLGIILYIMLCGYFPFYHENERELYRQIRKGSFDMPPEDWSHVSEAAKDLVKSMLTTDPRIRVSASDCLRHPWIAKPGIASKKPFPQASRDKLDMFLEKEKKAPKFKRVVDAMLTALRPPPPHMHPPHGVGMHGNPHQEEGHQAEAWGSGVRDQAWAATSHVQHNIRQEGARLGINSCTEEQMTSPLRSNLGRSRQNAGCTGKCSIM